MELVKLNIYQKLLRIQNSINGLGKNKDGFGYKYVTGDKVLEHIKPIMNEQGLLLKQEVLSIDNVRQDYTTEKGKAKNEILSKVMMKFTWVDCETGEKDENLFGANGQNDWDKGVGSALTYAERYFLLKYFHIATDEDDIDNPNRKPEDYTATTPPSTPVPPAAPKKVYLNPGTQQWSDAIKFLQGDGTIDQIKKKYLLTPLNEDNLKKSVLEPA